MLEAFTCQSLSYYHCKEENVPLEKMRGLQSRNTWILYKITVGLFVSLNTLTHRHPHIHIFLEERTEKYATFEPLIETEFGTK